MREKPYRHEMYLLNRHEVGDAVSAGMTGFEFAKLCESARAVCESGDALPSFTGWLSAKGISVSFADAAIGQLERGGFVEQG